MISTPLNQSNLPDLRKLVAKLRSRPEMEKLLEILEFNNPSLRGKPTNNANDAFYFGQGYVFAIDTIRILLEEDEASLEPPNYEDPYGG